MIRVTKAVLLAFTSTAIACGLLAACSGSPATYAPQSYGVPGHCYYVSTPAEAISLQQSGLCPRSWAPTLMPLAWHEEYYPYYSSSAYYSRYVPASSRTVYVHAQTTFGSAHSSAIRTAASRATYKSSNGGTVNGSKVATSKTHFGSGTSFGQTGTTHGGGTGRSGSGSVSHGGGVGRSGGSHGGGSSGGHGGGGGRG